MFACHQERENFKSVPALKSCFVDDNDCICIPDSAVLDKCLAISNSPLAKRRLAGTDSSLFVVAIAAAKNFGVISDHRSLVFTTAYDLCVHYGIPVFSADEFFSLL
jgi:hypothetical protein